MVPPEVIRPTRSLSHTVKIAVGISEKATFLSHYSTVIFNYFFFKEFIFLYLWGFLVVIHTVVQNVCAVFYE